MKFEEGVVYTVAQVKGRRLRMARALTGLSRQNLYEKIGIATSTMDTWESGRVELTEKSALRICDSFRKIGIFCSVEWLLTGKGMPPHSMNEAEKSMFVPVSYPKEGSSDSIEKKNFRMPPFLDISVKKELCFFMNLHEKPMFCIVREKFLNSQYDIGDCVAGIEESPEKLIGKIVILQTEQGDSMLCRLIGVNDNVAKVFLSTKSPSVEVSFLKIAKVLWHRMMEKS